MNDVVDEESRFDEGDCDHEEGRRVAGELLRVGEGAHDALQRRRLLRRQSVLPDCLKKVLQEKEPQGSWSGKSHLWPVAILGFVGQVSNLNFKL